MTTGPTPAGGANPTRAASLEARKDEIARLTLRYNRLFEPALLVLLVLTMLLGPITLIRLLTPGFPWGHMPAMVFFVALEGVATTSWLAHPDRLILNKPGYRLAEFLLLLLVVRFVTWAIYVPLTWETMRGYLLDPLSFIDGAFVIMTLVVLFAWAQACAFAARINALALSPAERAFLLRTEDDERRMHYDGTAQSSITDRSSVIAGFFAQWLNGGLILMLSGALTTVNYDALRGSDFALRSLRGLGLQPAVLGALVLYFVAGLYLLSGGRLQVMRVRWLLEEAETAPAVHRTWRRSSALLLLLVGFGAAFLPIGSTVPIALLVDVALNAIVTATLYLVGLIVLLFALLASLFGRGATATSEPEVPAEIVVMPTPMVIDPTTGMSEEARLALGGGFWLIVVVLVVIAVLFYLRERGIRFNSTLLRLLWHDLRRAWRSLWGGVSRRAEAVGGAVRSRLRLRRSDDPADAPPFRFIRVNGLPPRERIRYFYLSTVRRARDRGAARQEDETPLEYLEALRKRWPEAEEDLDALTDAFVEARYSRQSFSEADVGPIKRTWRRVKSGLRRKPPPAPPPSGSP